MQRRPITQYDYKMIRQTYTYLSDDEIAILLDRTYNSVKNMRVYLKLTRSQPKNPYTKADIQFIKDNYTMLSDAEIGEKINRTAFAICHKRSELKLIRKQAKDRSVSNKVYRMRELIKICETTTSPYVLDKSKEKLRKLSGL